MCRFVVCGLTHYEYAKSDVVLTFGVAKINSFCYLATNGDARGIDADSYMLGALSSNNAGGESDRCISQLISEFSST